MNWKNLLQDYAHYLLLERGLSQNSVKSYVRDNKKLFSYLEAQQMDSNPLKTTEEELRHFLYTQTEQLSERSRARLISSLRSFFEYLIFEEYRQNNPTELLETPKIGRKLPDTLSLEEIDKIIAGIDLSHPQGERNRSIIETLYGCGLRVSELIQLKISDLFLEEGFIKVTGKGDKQRFVPLSPLTKKYLLIYQHQVRSRQRIQKGNEDFLYLNRNGKALTRAMIFTLIKQAVKKVGIDKNISPHTFRHSFATHLLENGADLSSIQQMLGHESITTTEIYVHVQQAHLKNLMQKFHPRK